MSLLAKISQNNLAYMIGAEVLGTNIPRIALTRTPQERLDVFTDEATSSVGFFGGGLVLDRWLDALFKQAFTQGGAAARWARFGKTFGVGSVLSGFLVAVSYLRNYVTAAVNKTSQFNQIIQTPTYTGQAPNQQGVASLKQEKAKAIALGALSLGLGALGSLAAVAMAKHNIAKGVPWQTLNHLPLDGAAWHGVKALNALSHCLGAQPSQLTRMLADKKWYLADFLDKRILFGGQQFLTNPDKRQFLNLTNPAAFLFWVLPTYTGYFTGSRSNLERMEAVIKFLNFSGSFFLMPPLLEQGLVPAIKKYAPQLAQKPGFMEDAQFLIKQSAGIGSLVGTTMAYQALSAHLLKQQQQPTHTQDVSVTVHNTSPRLVLNLKAFHQFNNHGDGI
jgi:hypothetical protein